MKATTPHTAPDSPGTASAPVIRIRDLRKSFGDNAVLRGFNLELHEHENLVVMGKIGRASCRERVCHRV